jgi:hypothetical protein
MRRACRALFCVVILLAALCAPAAAAPTNGQLAAVVDGRLVTVNPDGSGRRTWLTDAGQVSELAFSPDGNRLAYVKGGELWVLDLVAPSTSRLTSAAADANPGWSQDGATIAFRRGLLVYRVAATGGAPQRDVLGLDALTSAIAWAPGAKDFTPLVGGLLLAGLVPPAAAGIPAWAPDGHALAFARAGGLSTIAPGQRATAVLEGADGSPRWSGDSGSLVYTEDGAVRTLELASRAVATPLAGERLGPVDWQPCVANVTLSCESVAPPRCSALTATATTLSDQAIDLPAPPCTDPAWRPLSLVVVKPPDHGTVSGLRYTPDAGFSGQDTVAYRVNNGVLDSEGFRVTVFVVPRPVAPQPRTRPPVLVQGAPFLSATATPRLDRRRRTLVKVTCDQDCSLTVRLSAKLRTRRTFTGPLVKRTIMAKRVVRLRLRLPLKPRGTLKTVWVTGQVRNQAGATRGVKLPVRLPR